MPIIRPRPIAILLAFFIVIGAAYAVTTPLFEASDELWHYPMVQHLSRTFELPVQDPNNVGPWRQEASQPPLYYYLMGWATAWIDTSDMPQVRWLNPHVDNGIITPDGNINLAIHSAEKFPWRGTALAVRLVRLLSVLMSAGTLLFTYLLAREFFENELECLATASFVAFTPMFAFISGAVNNDNLASLLSAAIVFLLVHWSKSSSAFRIHHSAFLGLLLGLAALTKQSALGLFALAGLTLLYIGFRQLPAANRRLPTALRPLSSFVILHSSFTFLPALLIAGWWYARNVVLYGDLLGWNAFIAVLGKRAAPAPLVQLWGERFSFAKTFWGLFGGINVPMPDWVYTVLNAAAVVAIFGCVFAFLRWVFWRGMVPRYRFNFVLVEEAFSYFLLAAHVGFVVYGLIQWATITWSSQGRLIFSSLSALGVLYVAGLRALLPRGARPFVFAVIGVFMAVISAVAPFVWIAPKYADPPPLTDVQVAAIPNRTDTDFGALNFPPEMRLLGYALDSATAAPGGAVRATLYWQSLVAMDRDWSVFVHIVDDNQIVVAQRDTYPGLGLMPTRKWAVGQTLADTYVISLPPTTYAPSEASIEIGLYDYNSGERLLIVSGDQAGRDALKLSVFTIAANAGDVPNPQTINFGDQIALAGYAMDRRALAAGESLKLTLYWRGLTTITQNYSVFAHVRGAGESLWAQSDGWPRDGKSPTVTWSAGQIVSEVRTLTLKPDTAPGVYDVEVGLYDKNGDRLQIVLPDGRRTDNFVYLAKIRVLP